MQIKTCRIFRCAALVLSVGLTHVWLLIANQTWTVFGYDYGFYRRYLIEPFTSLPHASVPGLDHTVILPRIILDIVRLLGMSTDITLVLSYVLVIVFFLGAFWLWVSHISSRNVAAWAIILVILSPLYLYTYWSFLFKNFLSLGLLFTLLYAIRKQYWWAIVAGSILLPVTHQSTTILAGIIMFGVAVMSFSRRGNWRLPLVSWALLLGLYLVYHPSVMSKVVAPPVAAFLSDIQALTMLLPVLIIAVWSIWRYGRAEFLRHDDLLVMTTVAFAFPLLGLPFHERVYPLLLISLSVLSGYVIARVPLVWKVALLLLVVIWYVSVVRVMVVPNIQIYDLIKSSRIETLGSEVSLLSPNHLAPWLHGYTTANVFAPGLFKDPFLSQDWEYYWSGTNKAYNKAFLDSFPAPLYIFAPSGQEHFLPEIDCLEQVSPVLYRYTCYD